MNAPLCFLDCETTGLSLDDDIWEIAAIRREPDGKQRVLHLFVDHDPGKCDLLPQSFLNDHLARFPGHCGDINPELLVLDRRVAAARIGDFTARAHIIGAVPNFDTERIALLMASFGWSPTWHYHLIDVENLIVGHLAARGQALAPPWNSEDLCRYIGIDPDDYARHTAMGDVEWAAAIYDKVMGNR